MSLRQRTLLVVDDDPFNQEIIAGFLANCEYRLVMTSDGNEALEKLMADPEGYDAVLLDRVMPGIDGLEVLKKIKQDVHLQTLPVIMQTGSVSPEQIAEGLRYGAFYYLTKPFSQKVLLAVTANAIRGRFELRNRESEQSVKYSALKLLRTAEYTFRTREEAYALASLLAYLSPSPEPTYMGLVELMVNAIEHGNLDITYDEKTQLINDDRLLEEINRRLSLPEHAHKWVTVTFSKNTDMLTFTIIDNGKGFEWENYLTMSMERLTHNHGRGIAMAKSIAFSTLKYQGKGNCVTATIAI